MFRSVTLEQRVPQDYPLRAIRGLTDAVLVSLSDAFDALYPASGRPWIAPKLRTRSHYMGPDGETCGGLPATASYPSSMAEPSLLR